jgi:hypothetical protein
MSNYFSAEVNSVFSKENNACAKEDNVLDKVNNALPKNIPAKINNPVMSSANPGKTE